MVGEVVTTPVLIWAVLTVVVVVEKVVALLLLVGVQLQQIKVAMEVLMLKPQHLIPQMVAGVLERLVGLVLVLHVGLVVTDYLLLLQGVVLPMPAVAVVVLLAKELSLVLEEPEVGALVGLVGLLVRQVQRIQVVVEVARIRPLQAELVVQV
jgi:hypothetical protein